MPNNRVQATDHKLSQGRRFRPQSFLDPCPCFILRSCGPPPDPRGWNYAPRLERRRKRQAIPQSVHPCEVRSTARNLRSCATRRRLGFRPSARRRLPVPSAQRQARVPTARTLQSLSDSRTGLPHLFWVYRSCLAFLIRNSNNAVQPYAAFAARLTAGVGMIYSRAHWLYSPAFFSSVTIDTLSEQARR